MHIAHQPVWCVSALPLRPAPGHRLCTSCYSNRQLRQRIFRSGLTSASEGRLESRWFSCLPTQTSWSLGTVLVVLSALLRFTVLSAVVVVVVPQASQVRQVVRSQFVQDSPQQYFLPRNPLMIFCYCSEEMKEAQKRGGKFKKGVPQNPPRDF